MPPALLALLLAVALVAGEPTPLGGKVGPFTLDTLSGQSQRFTTEGKITVVVFLSTVCPISNEYNDRLIALYRTLEPQGVQMLFVNANQNEPVADVARHREQAEFPFPVLKDTRNRLADRLGATVTPETFVLDRGGILRYRGQIDDSRNPARVRHEAVREAVQALLAGEPVKKQETKAFGCTIKRVRKSS